MSSKCCPKCGMLFYKPWLPAGFLLNKPEDFEKIMLESQTYKCECGWSGPETLLVEKIIRR